MLTSDRRRLEKNGKGRLHRWMAKLLPSDRLKEPSVEDINRMLIAAEQEDMSNAETIAIADYRGFGTYNANEQVSVSLLGDHALPAGGRYILRSGGTYLGKERTDPLDMRYTCQIKSSTLNPLLSSDRRIITAEIAELAHELKDSQVRTMLGVLNDILYQAAECSGIIEYGRGFENSKRIEQVSRKTAAVFAKGQWILWNAIGSTVRSLKKNWTGIGAAASRQSVIRATNWLARKRLLNFTNKFEPGVWAKSRRYQDVDVHRCLILFSILEERVGGFEAMPAHHGSLAKHLWNAIFPGFGYRRAERDMREPDDWDTTDAVRANRTRAPLYPVFSEAQQVVRDRLSELVEEWRSLRGDKSADRSLVARAKAAWQQYRDNHSDMFCY